jgi:rhodanese-related sulfurtransferase
MKRKLVLILMTAMLAAISANGQKAVDIPNPAIDMKGYIRIAKKAAKYRESRRLTEEEFVKMAAEEGTIVLDARSRKKYDELHIKGAVNLSFPDITVESLNTLQPDKNTRILIYCNNNFRGNESAFPAKVAPASLNISTYIALYTYGYRNVYELGPLLDVATSKLSLVNSAAVSGVSGP